MASRAAKGLPQRVRMKNGGFGGWKEVELGVDQTLMTLGIFVVMSPFPTLKKKKNF